MLQTQTQPFYVTVVPDPAESSGWGELIMASLGLAGVLALTAVVLGVFVALGLILWRRRHPAEAEHLPSVTSSTPLHPPSAQVQ